LAVRIAALVALVAGCQTAFMTIQTKTQCPRDLKSQSNSRTSIGLAAWLTAGLLICVAGCVHTDRPQPPEATTAQGAERVKPDEHTRPDGSSPEEAKPQRDALVDAIARLSEHGLDPEEYGLSHILNLSDDPDARAIASRNAWRLAATHLAHGVLVPETLQPRRVAEMTENAMLKQLDAQGGSDALAAALDGLAPQHPEYLALRAELARQQAAMVLETDPAALASHAALIGQLRVNLERWRWLPHALGPRYVIANIPGFDVAAMEQNTVHARHTAIFGKMNRETPAFSDSIEYIIFNPWWDVPDSIARADKLPLFRRDPGVVSRLGYRVFDRQGQAVNPADINWADVSAASFPYRLRQAPGPANALGQVKIMFPNPHNVYLHDTPDRSLFDADHRTFSSGCIRVKEPLDLAAWLLEDTPGWDRTHIDAAVASRAETRVDLLAPVPVYVVYFTAVDDSCGGVRYLPDIYGRDTAVLAALNTPVLR
jgi:murein L,D-transpeptidase YcbB/YkuD